MAICRNLFRGALLTSAAFSVALVGAASSFQTPAFAATNGVDISAVSDANFDRSFLRDLTMRIRSHPQYMEQYVENAKRERPHLAADIDRVHKFLAYEFNLRNEIDISANTDEAGNAEEGDQALGEEALEGGPMTAGAPSVPLMMGGLAALGGLGAVVASGGGGGSDGGSKDKGGSNPPQPPKDFPEEDPYDYSSNPRDYETGEYAQSPGKTTIKASEAYARGYSGFGVTVAVMDDGFDLSHPEFKDRISGAYNALKDNGSVAKHVHGTHVAGIIGAAKDGKGMHGVAWQSHLMPISFAADDGGMSTGEKGKIVGRGWSYAAKNGAQVINNSWSITGVYAGDYSRERWQESFSEMVKGAMAMKDADMTAVFSTGNDRKDQPSVVSAMPMQFPELEGHWVAVAALDNYGNLASYSNACGAAAAWCISAPGTALSAVPGGGYAEYSGTSMAAPYVSGSIAVLRSAFPYLSSPEILDILFETADDMGDASKFGHGLLNLEKATRPVGETTIPTGSTINGSGYALGSTSFQTSPAFGDGVAMALAGESVMALDKFNRGYEFGLDNFISDRSKQTRRDYLHQMKLFGGQEERSTRTIEAGPFSITSSQRLRASDPTVGDSAFSRVSFGFSGDHVDVEMALNPDVSRSFGLRDIGFKDAPLLTADAFDQPHFSMMETGYGSALGFNLGQDTSLRLGVYTGSVEIEKASVFENTPSVTGAVGEFRTSFLDSGTLSLALGAISEQGSLLGSVSKGAFGDSMRSNTLFTTIGGTFDVAQNTRLTLSGSLGHTNFKQDGLIRGGSDIITSSFGVGLSRHSLFQDADAFSVAVSQPLRVESGRLDMRVPSVRKMDGTIGYRSLSFNPQPSGREINLQASYGFDLMDGVRSQVGAVHRINPGHSSSRAAESMALMTVSFSF